MTIPENSGLSRIGQIAINAYDVDRATAFYRDVLGLPHLFACRPVELLRLRRRALDARQTREAGV